ncbi:MAG: Crp/Fnr family transcriptional regulator [Vulcanimicrobiota bacterium]
MERCDPSSCRACAARLAGTSIFSGVSDQCLDAIEATRAVVSFPRGHVIYREGEKASGIYCVSAGVVRMYRLTADGNEHLLAWAGPGQPLGYRAFFAEGTHSATAETVTAAEFCFLSDKALKNLMSLEPNLATSIIERLARELQSAENRWFSHARKTARARVAELLLEFAVLPEHLHYYPTRLEMAQLCGLTPETLARVLTDFHQRGIVSRSRKAVELLDLDSLQEISQEGAS